MVLETIGECRMRSLVFLGVAVMAGLSGCSGSNGSTASNVANGNVASTVDEIQNSASAAVNPASPCTAEQTQETLRRLIGSAVRSSSQAAMTSGMTDSLLLVGMGRTVIQDINLITFSETTAEENGSKGGITCVTSLGVLQDKTDEASPRLTYKVQPTVDSGDAVITLAQPFEIRAALPFLSSGMLRVEQEAERQHSDGTSDAGSADEPAASATPVTPSDEITPSPINDGQ